MKRQSHDKEFVLTEDNKAEEQLATAEQNSPKHDESSNQQEGKTEQARPSQEENPNWREVRNIMQEQRSKIENLERELTHFRNPAKQEEADPLDSLSEDDVVTVADMKRYAAKVAKSTAQELYEKNTLQQEIESTPNRYSDYYDVIKYVEPLVKQNPALMGAIERAPNPREAAYQMAKMYLQTQNTGSQTAQKIEENLSKPKPADSLSIGQGVSGGMDRKDLSLEDRAKIWEQAQRYASMR